jgi:hypothetical protein
LAGCWWLTLICSERKVLLADWLLMTGLFWEKNAAAWWRTGRVSFDDVFFLQDRRRLPQNRSAAQHTVRMLLFEKLCLFMLLLDMH